jgi:hypothetical protein
MSTNDTPGQKSSGTTDATTRLLPQHVYLGRDREGYRHHLDRDANTVTRFDDDGRIERVTPLGDAHLDDYLRFVAEEVGWKTRKQAANWDFIPRGLF